MKDISSPLSYEKTIHLIPPKISKKDIYSVTMQNQLLPPKSTRHILPYKVPPLNVPLSFLNGHANEIKKVVREKP